MLGLGPVDVVLRQMRGPVGPPGLQHLVILAYGQSNEAGSTLTSGSFIDPVLDQDASGRIRVWNPTAARDDAAVQPLVWPGTGQNCPARSFRLAQALLSVVTGKIVIVPVAVGGAKMTGGPLGLGGSSYAVAKARLTACLAAFPGAEVVMSWTQGEQDANENVTQAQYTAAFTAMLADLRSVPGAARMGVFIHQMQPIRFIANSLYAADRPTRVAIDAAHKAIPLSTARTVFVGADVADTFAGYGDPTHFDAAGHRDAGNRAAVLMPLIQTWQTTLPAVPAAPVIVTGRTIRIAVPQPQPPAWVVAYREAGSSGAWTEQPACPPVWTDAGGTFDVAIPGGGAVDVRLHARSFAGTSAPSAVVRVAAIAAPPAAAWWHPLALIHLDYPGDRAFVAGTAYASMAAARAAGAVVQTGGLDRVPIAVPAASWALVGTGVTGGGLPTVNQPRYLAAVDDGADGAPVDHLAWLAEALWGTTEAAFNVGVYTDGVSQLSNIPSADTSKPAGRSQPVRMGLRAKANACIVAMDGVTLGTDVACAVPAITQLVVGNRDNGGRPWQGQVHQVLFVNAEIDAATLNAALS
ncbi:hypothetical protein SAMN04488003_11850 [Loktanella fryxellensis]|uniref:Sialate O-acetylesterase domain-containing protein n=1 Tax=Loktanella fryxellensis TaxID=245187 RepID=A0A1H8GYH3_9RHOB|nr:sialate O-acetylesterase [Loktanella fryxellensis]SEN49181.1 hypothetical protein SAMN04488003_11850 [Loktanella fryxellensis]